MDWAKFFRLPKRAAYAPYAGQQVYPLAEMMRYMAGVSPLDYGWYAFSRELLRDKFSAGEKRALMEKAYACGREEAGLLRGACGGAGEAMDPTRAAKHLGVRICVSDAPADSAQVLFATFTEPDVIWVYWDAIERGEALLRDAETAAALPRLNIRRMLLWHEIFHVLELQKKEVLFTKTEKISLWRGPFSNRSTIRCLGEIAAMQFAAEMERVPYSPYCLDVLLVYGYDEKAASALFDEMKQVVSSHAGRMDGEMEADVSC